MRSTAPPCTTWCRRTAILTTLPLFHVGGLNNQTTPALRMGCTVVLHPKFEVEATFDAIERERITLTVLVPAQLEAMMAHPRWSSADFSSLRMITSGSMIVPERLIRAVHARGVPLVQVYGSTETCPIAACQKAADAQRKIGSAGRAAAHCEVRIVDDDGHDVAPGASGEILVRGPNVMSGYWNDRQATDAVLVDGWFHTGDMGHLDADGYLYVDGRRKDMIISGGENIYPAEIENLLMESPDIAEASVVGWPDAALGRGGGRGGRAAARPPTERGRRAGAARGPHRPLQASETGRLHRRVAQDRARQGAPRRSAAAGGRPRSDRLTTEFTP